jgi:hypothetical protein
MSAPAADGSGGDATVLADPSVEKAQAALDAARMISQEAQTLHDANEALYLWRMQEAQRRLE